MNRLLITLMMVGIVGTTSILGIFPGRTITNPQLRMVGARYTSLGTTNPTLRGDISGLFINPAVLGSIDPMPFSASSQKVLNLFDYKMVHAAFPMEIPIPSEDKLQTRTLYFGLSYGYSGLEGIPETISDNDRIRAISSFSSGIDILAGSAGTEFYDIFGFNTLSLGATGKVYRQFLKEKNRYALGLDVGTLATYYTNYLFVDQVQIGASLLNFLSSPFVWPDTGEEAFLPLNIIVGARVDMFNDVVSVYLHNAVEGAAASVEYYVDPNLAVRGGMDLARRFHFGTGLTMENIVGFENRNYSLRIDYNYSLNSFPFDQDPNHTVTFSLLGEARPVPPKILAPIEGYLTREPYLNLKGVSQKNTTIRIFDNDFLTRTTSTNKFGHWTFRDFPLKEGVNDIHIKSYVIEKDLSQESDHIKVTLDTLPPRFAVSVLPEGGKLKISVEPEEELDLLAGKLEKARLKFERKTAKKWEAVVSMPADLKNNSPVPSAMKILQINAQDQAGNKSEAESIPFFVQLGFPKDKYVHNKSLLRLIGNASPMVKLLNVDDDGVYIDPQYNFAFSKKLEPGKNLLRLKVRALNDEELTYLLHVLYLVSFPDVDEKIKERRDIEFMATLGLLTADADENFHPNDPVTRMFVAKMMVNAKKYPAPKVKAPLFSDVPANYPDAGYIQAAIENGLIFANPDGTFQPNQPLTMADIIFYLSNAGMVDEQEIEDPNKIPTRKELARFLAESPRYERQIEGLIDWNRGYK